MSETKAERPEAFSERISGGLGGLFYGVYPALVVDARDPQGRGRVKLRLPWLGGSGSPQLWARLATLSAGDRSGSWFPPQVGAEVLVAFEAGDLSQPYVIGALWNGQDRPPEVPDKPGYAPQVLSTPRGTRILLDEGVGGGSLRLETPEGQTLLLSDSPEGIEITEQSGTRVALKNGDVEIAAPGKISVQASQIELAGAVVRVDAALLEASGIVKCTTLQTDTVIAATYTPGAGNIW